MLIKSLKLKNYRKFKELNLNFQTGLNVVRGNNEAGKSTMQSALLDVLLQEPGKKNKEIEAMRNWENEKLPVMELLFEEEGVKHLLVKDFESKAARLDEVEGGPDVQKEIAKKLPFFSSDMFLNTSVISAANMNTIKADAGGFQDAIRNIAIETGAEVSLDQVFKMLDKEISALESKGQKGKLKNLELARQGLKNEIFDAKKAFTERQEAKRKLQELSGNISELQTKINDAQDLLEKNKGRFGQVKEQEQINLALERIQNSLEQRSKIKAQISGLQAKVEADELYLSKSARADLSNLQFMGQQKTLVPVKKQTTNIYLKPAVTLALFILGAVLAAIFSNLYLLLAGVLFAGAAWLLFGSLQAPKLSGAEQEDYSEKIQTILNAYQVASAKELQDKIEAAEELSGTLQGAKNTLKILEEQESEAELLDKERPLIKKKRELTVLLEDPEIKAVTLDQAKYNALNLANAKNTQDLKTLEEQKFRLEGTLDRAQADAETIGVLEEKAELLEAEWLSLNQELAALKLLEQGLKSSVADTASASQTIIEKEVAKYLPLLTEGRYEKIRINEKLEIEVYSAEKKDWLNPRGTLSAGTLDQIYFLTRLAFIKYLDPQKKFPIILDDPFLTFDEHRLEAAKEVVLDQAKSRQVLLFTFNKAYSAWGGAVSPLDL